MSIVEQINKAISCHSSWKMKLKNAVEVGKCDVAPEEVAKDNTCILGAWLHSNVEIKKHKNYIELLGLHAQFHVEAAKIVQFIHENKLEDAKEALSANSEYTKCSKLLTKLLLSMQ